MKIVFSIIIVLLIHNIQAQNFAWTEAKVDGIYHQALVNYTYLFRHVPVDSVPQSYSKAKNGYVFKQTKWWCAGFFPGSLLYISHVTKDQEIYSDAVSELNKIKNNQFDSGTHDIGFKIMCGFGLTDNFTPNEQYRQTILNAANTLLSRYRPKQNSIQSWSNNKHFQSPVIIDNMMNLELLEKAYLISGNKKYDSIARQHALTTIKTHFRKDYSTYHVVDFDPETGQIIHKGTYQGYSDSSCWARGEAWALYGYTMMYRYTKEPVFLTQALHVADYLFSNENLVRDKVPYWDLNDPRIPNTPKDASAAAIIASGFLDLSRFVSLEKKKKYVSFAKDILSTLASDKYFNASNECGGFLLRHSTGNYPQGVDIDVPIIYADYYFLEGLFRLKEWYL